MVKHFVDSTGKWLGSYDGPGPVIVASSPLPAGAVEVPSAPDDNRRVWDFATDTWGPKPAPPPDPDDELNAAIADAIKDEAPNSPVRKLGEALLGQAGKAGRIAGRPV